MINDLCGCIVLYNPGDYILSELEELVYKLDLLIVFDNSEISNKLFAECTKLGPKIIYLTRNENLGIGVALNSAAKTAFSKGYKYMFTIDQDVDFRIINLDKLYQNIFTDVTVGISSPYHLNDLKPENINRNEIKDVLTVMMAGNIINLDIWRKVGGFNEKLFIDYVDHEYCLRLNKFGYKVLQDTSVTFLHKLGSRRLKKIFNFKFSPSNHSPIRLYYRTRNRFFVYQNYWSIFHKYVLLDFLHMFREVMSVILFESERIKKIKMIIFGFYDFITNRYGKCTRIQ